jgi:hypothetical protein
MLGLLMGLLLIALPFGLVPSMVRFFRAFMLAAMAAAAAGFISFGPWLTGLLPPWWKLGFMLG